MLPSFTFSMSNAALHNHGISGSGSLHNTSATPTGPSNPESALTPSWLHRRSSRDARLNSDSLGPANDGTLTLPQRADHTAVPELEGQSHEDEDSRPTSTRTCQEPPVPSSSSAPPCGGHGPQDWHLLASSLLLNNCLKTGTQGIFVPRHEHYPRTVSYTHLTLPTKAYV